MSHNGDVPYHRKRYENVRSTHILSFQSFKQVPPRACPLPLHGRTNIDTPSQAVCTPPKHPTRIIPSSTTPLIPQPPIIPSKRMYSIPWNTWIFPIKTRTSLPRTKFQVCIHSVFFFSIFFYFDKRNLSYPDFKCFRFLPVPAYDYNLFVHFIYMTCGCREFLIFIRYTTTWSW